jgi:hypothetical protein
VVKRGESRPFRVEYRWPTMPRPAVRSVERTRGDALFTAERQATIAGGRSGERDCLVRVVDHREPDAASRWFRACPSCPEVTGWAPTAGEWRHFPRRGAAATRLCADGTNPPRADEDPVVLWTAVAVDS